MTLTALQRKHSLKMQRRKKPKSPAFALSPSKKALGLADWAAVRYEGSNEKTKSKRMPRKLFKNHA